MILVAPAASVAHVRAAEADLRASGRISELAYAEGDVVEVRDAELVPVEEGAQQGLIVPRHPDRCRPDFSGRQRSGR